VTEKITLHRAHPWHGLPIGDQAPELVNCYIEIVPTDTIKYELDKKTGLLKVDRPQKYSSLCPSLYGFVPQTYAGNLTAKHCMQMTKRSKILGDNDPIDICILTEKTIPRGDIILQAIPIGGFRMIDGNEADDKLIATLKEDFIYGNIKEVAECPTKLIERLRHYFLTYKSYPGCPESHVEILDIFDSKEAKKVIEIGTCDYRKKFAST